MEKLNEIQNGGKPYYDRRKKEWKVDIPDWGTDSGSLTEVVYTLLRTSMYFPFESGERRRPEYEPHYHEFEGILKEIIWDPENFTITEDQKQFYSEQELTLIYQLRDRIMEMNREGTK